MVPFYVVLTVFLVIVHKVTVNRSWGMFLKVKQYWALHIVENSILWVKPRLRKHKEGYVTVLLLLFLLFLKNFGVILFIACNVHIYIDLKVS